MSVSHEKLRDPMHFVPISFGAAWGSGERSDADVIVYADKSGDHGMANIDAQCPVFEFTFCALASPIAHSTASNRSWEG